MAYTHLTDEQRCDIYELHVKGFGIREIAKRINRDKGTVSRELRRNRGERGYRPKQAHEKACDRLNGRRGGNRVEERTWQAAEALLLQNYSPEQAAGRVKKLGFGSISHETIYKRIYADKAEGGALHEHLRCNKKRRKRYGSGRTRRGRIPNRVGIEERSPRVEDRATVGHWEGDLVIGKNHKWVIVTLVERRTGFALVQKVRTKNAHFVAAAIIAVLMPYKTLIRTITFDNGLEFSQHESISESLDAKIYFANPYCSWERGTNENYNGLLRQYFPKGSCFAAIKTNQLRDAEKQLNDRARKRLAWSTPSELFAKSAKQHGVAIGS
jgi:IS30 family transposase